MCNKKIKFLQSDRGGEYLSYEFGMHLKECGIVSQLTPLRYADWGGPLPHRPAEDSAFAVARFYQRGGSLQNYYMVICSSKSIVNLFSSYSLALPVWAVQYNKFCT